MRYEVATPSGKTLAPPANGWRWAAATLQAKVDSGEIIFDPDETRIIRKIYLSDQEGRIPENVWTTEEVGGTRDGNRELKDLFGEAVFDTVKPVGLVRRMLDLSTRPKEGDVVLDFFAGSGTTAQAVLESNRDDAGNRRFILVQLPEPTDREDYPTIADICSERVRRAIAKLDADDAAKLTLGAESSQERGFRLFKLTESNFTPWNADASKSADDLGRQLALHVDHIRDGRTASDLLYEILLKSGFPLTTPVETVALAGATVHSVAEGALLVCLERELTLDQVRAMAERKPERVVCLDEGFAGNDQLKANAVQIFKVKGVTSFKTV
jgi:adenine-specific DNA-methyltransferase